MINITPTDILKNSKVTPGIYNATVTGHSYKPAKDGSRVDFFEITLEEGPSAHNFAGVPIQDYTISEKAVGMGIDFFNACGAGIGVAGSNFEKGGTIDPKNCVGKKVLVNVVNDVFNGRTLNKANGFLPYGTQIG